MFKKITFILLTFMFIATGSAIFAILSSMEDTVTNLLFTKKITIQEGVCDPAETIIPLTIAKDDTYIFYSNWSSETEGLLTGLNIVNEAGKSVLTFVGENVEIETKPIMLTSGEYSLYYKFLSNNTVLDEFLKETEQESFREGYPFGDNMTFEVNFEFKIVRAESLEYEVGFIVGLLFTLIAGGLLTIFLLKILKKDFRLKCQYDERQLLARKSGFQYGFFTLIGYNIILAITEIIGLDLPIASGILLFLGIILSGFVFILYCIYKEAYISLNENVTRLTIVFSLLALINILIGILHIYEGTMVENGIVQVPILNLTCGILMSAVIIALFLRNPNTKEADETEE